MSKQRRFKWEDLPEAVQMEYFRRELPAAVPGEILVRPPAPPSVMKKEIFTLTEANMDEAVDWVRKWNQDSLRFLRGVLRTEPTRMPRVFKVRPGDGGQGWLDLVTLDGVSIYWHPDETLKYVHLGEFRKVESYGLFERRTELISAEDVAKLRLMGWCTDEE